MKERIKKLAEQALREEIYLPLTTVEVDPAWDEYPEPVRIAYGLRALFRAMPVEDFAGELLTKGFRLEGAPLVGCAYLHTNHTHWEAFFHDHSDYMPNHLAMIDWNHYCADYRTLVNEGFRSRRMRIQQARRVHAGDRKKLEFLDGIELALDGIQELCERFGQRVPYEPATTFAEAVESVWMTFLLMPDSIGRLDSVLYPFYRRDIDAGILTREEAEEYIGELLVKIFARKTREEHRSGDHTMVVGGYEYGEDGMLHDGFTELSEMILRVRVELAELSVWRPQISFRYTNQTTPETMRFVTEMNARCSDIVFTNDETFLAAFARQGFDPSDAVDYTKVGCNEWAIMGHSNTGSDGFFNVIAALEELLHFNADQAKQCGDFEAFYQLFLRYLKQSVTFMCDLADQFYEANAGDTNILSSLIIQGCIEKATSLTAGGAKYNASCWAAIGIVNLADALSVIRQFVFEEQRVTMGELCSALHDDWRGHEQLKAEIAACGRFFGNDDDFVDSLVNRIIHDLDALANRRPPRKGGRYLFGCYIGYNYAHISMGLRTRATPDGRSSGEAFTAGIIAASGRDQKGLCAFLNSAAKLDYTTLCAPLAVNLRLDANLKCMMDKISVLYHVFLRSGGLQLQPDYLSAEELRDAQAHPERWPNLRVRVTGFTGYFVRFAKEQQDEIIARTEHGWNA